MAKPQKKRPARPSWFQKQIERGGQDFLMRKPPMDIQKEAMNIIRDIARGNITQKDLPYLFDMKLLSNVRIALFEKYRKLYVTDSAMSYVMQVNGGVQFLEANFKVAPEDLQREFNEGRNTMMAYGAILQNLDAMIAYASSGYPQTIEGFESIYPSAQYQISRFKYIV